MRRFLLLVVLLMISITTTAVYAQRVQNWTYYRMNNWDTSPYQAFRFTASNGQPMNFRLLYPKNYNPSTKYPMIVMLHGYGEAGRRNTREFYSQSDPRFDNNDYQLLHGGREHLSAYYNNRWNGFVLFPQNDYGSWVGGKGDVTTSMHRDMVKVLELIEYLTDSYVSVDPFRISLHGLSNGGAGTWYAAYKRPDLFASLLPMSNAGDTRMVPTLQYTPIWLFQGGKDTNPSPGVAENMINTLRNAGAEPRYTLYPNTGHGTWYAAYQEADFFPFMTRAHKLNIHVAFGNDEFCGGETFSTRMGIAPGFEAYQWRRNGQVINGADGNSITVSQYGDYQVRVRRKGVWSDWGPIRTIRDRCGGTQNRAPVFNAANNMTVTAGQSASQVIRASDPDGDAVSLSMASGAPSWVSFSDNGGGNGTLTASPGGTVSGNFNVTLRASDGQLTASSTITITVEEDGGGGGGPAGEVVYRVDAGGSSDISASPLSWSHDSKSSPSQYLDGSSNNNTAGASSFRATNTTGAPDQIFASMRFDYNWGGPVKYNFPLSNGDYVVNLFFAESPYSYGASAAGQRVFDIRIENAIAFNDYDIYARVQKNADKLSTTVTVADGTLNLELVRQTGNPQINGIEIVRAGSTTTATANAKTGSSTTQSTNAVVEPAETQVKVAPNVFDKELRISLQSATARKVQLRLIDLMGRTYLQEEAMATPAGAELFFSTESLNMPRGMYLLEVSDAESGEQQRMRIWKME